MNPKLKEDIVAGVAERMALRLDNSRRAWLANTARIFLASMIESAPIVDRTKVDSRKWAAKGRFCMSLLCPKYMYQFALHKIE